MKTENTINNPMLVELMSMLDKLQTQKSNWKWIMNTIICIQNTNFLSQTNTCNTDDTFLVTGVIKITL